MKFIGIIPARYASSRFPGKPLAMLGGKYVIQRVYETVSQVLGEAYVATDDERIYNAVIAFGGKAVMTLECIVVALVSHNLKLALREDVLLAVSVGLDRHELKAYSIVQALLVDDVAQSVLLASLGAVEHSVVLAYHADRVPTLGNGLLPSSKLLGEAVVVGSELLEVGSLLDVELVIVVVQLALHGVVRSDSGDRVLDGLDPALAEALLVAVVVERQNLVPLRS